MEGKPDGRRATPEPPILTRLQSLRACDFSALNRLCTLPSVVFVATKMTLPVFARHRCCRTSFGGIMANQSVVDQVHAHFQGRTGKNTGGRLDPLCLATLMLWGATFGSDPYVIYAR